METFDESNFVFKCTNLDLSKQQQVFYTPKGKRTIRSDSTKRVN